MHQRSLLMPHGKRFAVSVPSRCLICDNVKVSRKPRKCLQQRCSQPVLDWKGCDAIKKSRRNKSDKAGTSIWNYLSFHLILIKKKFGGSVVMETHQLCLKLTSFSDYFARVKQLINNAQRSICKSVSGLSPIRLSLCSWAGRRLDDSCSPEVDSSEMCEKDRGDSATRVHISVSDHRCTKLSLHYGKFSLVLAVCPGSSHLSSLTWPASLVQSQLSIPVDSPVCLLISLCSLLRSTDLVPGFRCPCSVCSASLFHVLLDNSVSVSVSVFVSASLNVLCFVCINSMSSVCLWDFEPTSFLLIVSDDFNEICRLLWIQITTIMILKYKW